MPKTILVAGASRGIGLAVAEHFVNQCDRLLSVSRTASPVGEWIAADLSARVGTEMVANAIGDDCLDALLQCFASASGTKFLLGAALRAAPNKNFGSISARSIECVLSLSRSTCIKEGIA